MASAGRVLIIPKGDWEPTKQYEMLDLVYWRGTSWLAKKSVVVGLEPNADNWAYWMKICESADLSEVMARIQALESQMVGAISLDDIDLSGYASKGEVDTLKTDVSGLETRTDNLETNLSGLTETVSGIEGSMSGLSRNVSSLSGTVGGMETSIENLSKRNVLDYDKEVVMQHSDLPYTCPSAGEVIACIVNGTVTSNPGVAWLKIDKNNKPAAYLNLYSTGDDASIIPVATGDVISRNGPAGFIDEGTITFIPYKYQ